MMETRTRPLVGQTDSDNTVPMTVDDLFFSITDTKGVIKHANSVFARLSGYPFVRLVGAPHNIIRDVAMPRGAFRLVWDELHAGRPVASYVANENAHGQRYEVFAVIMPIANGYLSIRIPPMLRDMRTTVLSVFEHAREVERSVGGSAREEADAGTASILTQLADLHIPDMAALTRRIMPREVLATLEASAGTEPGAGEGPVADLLNGTHLISWLMRDLLSALDRLNGLAARISDEANTSDLHVRVLADVAGDLGRATPLMTAAFSSSGGEGDEAGLIDATSSFADEFADALGGFDGMPTRLHGLITQVETLASNIALFALQNLMIARFAVELQRGEAVEPPGTALRLLYRSLSEQAERLLAEVDTVETAAHEAATSIDEVATKTTKLTRNAAEWSDAVADAIAQAGGAPTDAVADLERIVSEVRGRASDESRWLGDLGETAQGLAAINVRSDAPPLAACLHYLDNATAAID